ncbi:hypothetical protein ZHAS_00015909 [Anopheles sinensis]|uniref:Uncharacterized protein n=1 Tax=Anopheles sinensis TaxID=74873 RepID=A0A084WCK3_ANOSI|nr:hypothetical protein ZHAS_00015909 [Anopheles sinensis]
MEQRLAEEEENHQREVELRKRLIALKLRHHQELEVLEKKVWRSDEGLQFRNGRRRR